MSNQPDNHSQGKVVIKAVSDDTIKLSVNGDVSKINKSASELETLLIQHGVSSFQVGEKIYNIGEIGKAEFNTIIQQHESSRSYRLRLFLLVFIPLLAITLGYFIYQYQVMQVPVMLTVTLKNLTPNNELPDPRGTLTLFAGDKIDKQTTNSEVVFKNILPGLKGEHVRLTFEANGFTTVDTTFVLAGTSFVLPVRRNNDLGLLNGYVNDEQGDPLNDVTISTQLLTVKSNGSGFFELRIPFEQQRMQQRVVFFKSGYVSKDITGPVLANEEWRIILEKK